MTLTKNKKGIYKVNYKTMEGVRSLSTKTSNLDDAKRVAKEAGIKELEQAANVTRLTSEVIGRITTGKKVTMETATKEWLLWRESIGQSGKTAYNSAQSMRQFLAHSKLGNTSPLLVNEQPLNAFINEAGGNKASTRAGNLLALSSFFDFCSAKGWCIGNPARLVRVRMDTLTHQQKETRRRNPFTDAEIKRLLQETEQGTFWHTAIAVGRYLGLRLGDICQLEWDCFSEPGKVNVWTEKKDRRVSLDLAPNELADAIAAVPPNATKYLFPEEAAIIRDVTKRAKLSVYFGRICVRNDILGKTAHDLRSAYVKSCMEKGIPIEHIAISVGHANIATTRRYVPTTI